MRQDPCRVGTRLRPGPWGSWKMEVGVVSENVSVSEDFLEEESTDQGSDKKVMRIGSREEGRSGAFAKKAMKEGPCKG